MVNNTNSLRFIIEDEAVFFEVEDGQHRQITMLRKRVPHTEPEYFDVWASDNKIIASDSGGTIFFTSPLSSAGFLEHTFPSYYSYKWLGPEEMLSMEESVGPAFEETLLKIGLREAKKNPTTLIPQETITAYEAANYRVFGDEPFVLKIGLHSPELLDVYRRVGCTTSTFITGYNPFSNVTEKHENVAAQSLL